MNRTASNHNPSIKIYCDGGARGNPGPAAIGFVVKSPTDKKIHTAGKYIGKATNNVAEYNAVIFALRWVLKNQNRLKKTFTTNDLSIRFYLDSSLVVNQINGSFKVKNSTLRELFLTTKNQQDQLTLPVLFTAIPRDQNTEADAVVNIELDNHHSSNSSF